ncbi:MAG TPA: LytTR family DNA-binding domain-containing protein [Chitinophagaceae bacterium]
MKNYCFVKQNGQIVKLNFEKVQLVEACRNYSKIVLDDNTSISLLRSMKEIESFLPGTEFIRIHKSFIIPVNRIRWVSGRQVHLDSGQTVPVGEIFAEKMNNLVMENML